MNACSGLLIHFKRVSRNISPVALMHTAHGRQRMEVLDLATGGSSLSLCFSLTFWRHISHGQTLSYCVHTDCTGSSAPHPTRPPDSFREPVRHIACQIQHSQQERKQGSRLLIQVNGPPWHGGPSSKWRWDQ
jgi:hypothetical protein